MSANCNDAKKAGTYFSKEATKSGFKGRSCGKIAKLLIEQIPFKELAGRPRRITRKFNQFGFFIYH